MTDATEIMEKGPDMSAPTEGIEGMLEIGELPDTTELDSIPSLMGDYAITEDGTESIFELLGDVAFFLAEDFTRSEPVTYRAKEGLFLMGFTDVEYTDDTDFNIPAGELFDVVGESESYGMYMISYGSQLFGIDKAGFELVAEKVK